MGNATSNAEALERRRIEREMRLGLYSGPTSGLNPTHMGMQPVNPYQHLGWPSEAWLRELDAIPHVPPQQLQRPYRPPPPPPSRRRESPRVQFSHDVPADHFLSPQDERVTTPVRRRQRQPTVLLDSPRSSITPPRSSPEGRKESPSPTKLRWVGTTPKNDSEISATDLLAPARRSLRYLESRERSHEMPEATRHRKEKRHSVYPTQQKDERYGETPALKPSLEHALYLLLLEEVEERTNLLSEEIDAFNVILASFSYAVELEVIRVAAFELFSLEKKARKSIVSQEKRDRRILFYWVAENFEDAKLSEGIREIQRRPSPQRTPSRSPWRFPLSPSADRFRYPTRNTESKNKSSFLSDPYSSPPPIPPDHPTLPLMQHPLDIPHSSAPRFGVPSKFFDDVLEGNDAEQNPARFAPRKMNHVPAEQVGSSAYENKNDGQQLFSQREEIGPWSTSALDNVSFPDQAAVTKPKSPSLSTAPAPIVAARSNSTDVSLGKRASTAEVVAPHSLKAAVTDHEHLTTGRGNFPYQEQKKPPEEKSYPLRGGGVVDAGGVTSGRAQQVNSAHLTYKDCTGFDTRTKAAADKSEKTLATRGGGSMKEEVFRVKQSSPSPPQLSETTYLRLRRAPNPPVTTTSEADARHDDSAMGREAQRIKGVSPPTIPYQKMQSPRPTSTESIKTREQRDGNTCLENKNPASTTHGAAPKTFGPNIHEHPHPSGVLDDLSPIHATTQNAGSVSSDSSIYMDPFSQMSPKRSGQVPTLGAVARSPELARQQAELDRKILHQRGDMIVSATPHRTVPPPPSSPPPSSAAPRSISIREDDPDEVEFNTARQESSAAVQERFATLLNSLS